MLDPIKDLMKKREGVVKLAKLNVTKVCIPKLSILLSI